MLIVALLKNAVFQSLFVKSVEASKRKVLTDRAINHPVSFPYFSSCTLRSYFQFIKKFKGAVAQNGQRLLRVTSSRDLAWPLWTGLTVKASVSYAVSSVSHVPSVTLAVIVRKIPFLLATKRGIYGEIQFKPQYTRC